jgi:3-oxoacyl-[acyl-carrier protein] reductase
VQCDVAKADDVERAFDVCLERFGRLDILVNNAAVTGAAVRHFLEIDEPLWDLVVDANLKGHFLCAHRAARHMVEQGGGVIINTSSGGGSRAPRHGRLRCAKGGVEAHTGRDSISRPTACAACIVLGSWRRATGPEAEERARTTAPTVPSAARAPATSLGGRLPRRR